jgi:histidine phosphotransferase ChpT
MKDDIKFAELICAKYSHDLAGPIGAISNGIEFLEFSDKDIRDKAIELIKTSAIQAVTRLQFFRQVYGFIKSDSESSLSDIMTLGDSFYSLTKIKLSWIYDENSEELSQCNARFAKVILNILFFASSMIIAEGEVKVIFNSSKKIRIELKAGKIIVDDYILSVLNGEMDLVELSTKNIHIYYFTRIINDLGVKLSVQQKDKDVHFVIE